MNKAHLILYGVPYQTESLFHSPWFADIVDEYFTIEHYDADKTYDANATFVMGCNHYLAQEYREQFMDRRVIVDALWESNTGKWHGCSKWQGDRHLILYGNAANSSESNLVFVPSWFWYNESLWYRHRNYDSYEPQRNYSKKMLIPSGKDRGWRVETLERLGTWLDDSYWSNVSHGKFLPGTLGAKRMDHRWFNPVWYDDTHFTVILESIRNWAEKVNFLTEKTYKPLAFGHPYMLIGAPGNLELLRQQGFETFDNCFDECYDRESDLHAKLDIIVANIEQYQWQPHDQETLRRTQHNRQRFFDPAVVRSGIINDVINPILHYLETT